MAKPLTADDLLPLVKHLTLLERARLVQLIGVLSDRDAAAYRAVPPGRDEFSADDEPLGWDAEGWEKFG
jgi:hypothetical protein